jgi:hypothetical protein
MYAFQQLHRFAKPRWSCTHPPTQDAQPSNGGNHDVGLRWRFGLLIAASFARPE